MQRNVIIPYIYILDLLMMSQIFKFFFLNFLHRIEIITRTSNEKPSTLSKIT